MSINVVGEACFLLSDGGWLGRAPGDHRLLRAADPVCSGGTRWLPAVPSLPLVLRVPFPGLLTEGGGLAGRVGVATEEDASVGLLSSAVTDSLWKIKCEVRQLCYCL